MSSERFEASINQWYASSRVANLDYLNLEFSKPVSKVTIDNNNFYCFHEKSQKHSTFSENHHLNYITDSITTQQNNLEFIYDRLGLLSRVTLKNFKVILENQNKQEQQIREIVKSQTKITKNTHQLAQELENQKPATKTQILQLVDQISQQPKLVEEEALKLTEALNHKIKEVERLLQEVKHVLTT